MNDIPVDLDKHRGMAAQKATDIRRMLADVEANAKLLLVSFGNSLPLNSHWYRIGAAPMTSVEKAAESPMTTVRLCGWRIICGAEAIET